MAAQYVGVAGADRPEHRGGAVHHRQPLAIGRERAPPQRLCVWAAQQDRLSIPGRPHVPEVHGAVVGRPPGQARAARVEEGRRLVLGVAHPLEHARGAGLAGAQRPDPHLARRVDRGDAVTARREREALGLFSSSGWSCVPTRRSGPPASSRRKTLCPLPYTIRRPAGSISAWQTPAMAMRARVRGDPPSSGHSRHTCSRGGSGTGQGDERLAKGGHVGARAHSKLGSSLPSDSEKRRSGPEPGARGEPAAAGVELHPPRFGRHLEATDRPGERAVGAKEADRLDRACRCQPLAIGAEVGTPNAAPRWPSAGRAPSARATAPPARAGAPRRCRPPRGSCARTRAPPSGTRRSGCGRERRACSPAPGVPAEWPARPAEPPGAAGRSPRWRPCSARRPPPQQAVRRSRRIRRARSVIALRELLFEGRELSGIALAPQLVLAERRPAPQQVRRPVPSPATGARPA